MPALIDSYTPTTAEALSVRRTHAVAEIRVEQRPTLYSSLSMWPYDTYERRINYRSLRQIDSIATLEDNWDQDDAIAPSEQIVQQAKSLIILFDVVGQKVYNVAPGPDGEVMVDIRHKQKSVEILFYPTKNKYVKFGQGVKPEQGLFDLTTLSHLMTWLNE